MKCSLTRSCPKAPITNSPGCRGMIWAPLAAQMLAAWVEGTPMPLEADLVDALDPARWQVRQARQMETKGQAERTERAFRPDLEAD